MHVTYHIFMKWTALFLLGSALLLANSHPDPLSVFRIHSTEKSPRKSPRKKRHSAIHYVASKRSLASYGRMGGEYLGPVYNNEALSAAIDPDLYTKHVLTDKPYLEMKAIDGPLPQEYATLFLKSKTLLNPIQAHLKVIVDKSDQRIYVYRDLAHLYTFKTSTARRGYYTVTGTFHPLSLERMHYSRKYHNSPMPWSVFFHGGFAIHGTESIHRLGRPASHGCVRTHPVSARRIYNLIRKYGKKNTEIIVRN